MVSPTVIDARSRPAELLARSFVQLVGLAADAAVPFTPVVIVTADHTPASAWLAAFLEAEPAATPVASIALWDGPTLGRGLAARGATRLHEELARHRVVVIDRIDAVGGPERQRAVAGLFDALHASGTAICVSLATHPSAAQSLDPHLASRLLGGLLVVLPDAPRPPVETGTSSTRRPASLGRILATVARHQECSVADLCGPSRCRAIAAARSLAMYVARVVTGHSFHAIGAACGGRDHSTVMHGVKVVARRLAHDAAFAGDVGRLVQRLAGQPSLATGCSFAVDSAEDCLARASRHGHRRRNPHRRAANRPISGGT